MKIEFDREEDGRWIAEIPDMPGVMCYGVTKAEAQERVEALAAEVKKFWMNARTDYAALTPEERAEEKVELRARDITLSDGLKDDE